MWYGKVDEDLRVQKKGCCSKTEEKTSTGSMGCQGSAGRDDDAGPLNARRRVGGDRGCAEGRRELK
jgi:hypothetical protein